MLIRFTILGAPRTKKNHSSIVAGRGKGGNPIPRLMPSKAFREWNKIAQLRLIPVRQQIWRNHPEGLAIPLNCRAIFYRDAERGDLVGYMQSLADALEEAKILQDDVFIRAWDGTRLRKDAANPRIEVELEELILNA